jgi:hypothetical protein
VNRSFLPCVGANVHCATSSALDFFCGDDRAAAMALLEHRVKEILAAEGASAFAMPADAAAAHEGGHAVVMRHEGLAVRRVEIFKAPITGPATSVFGTAWAGNTSGKKWAVDDTTNFADDLRRARVVIGGLAAEAVWGVARSGSSLDEIITAQAIVVTAATKLGVGGEELWPKVWMQALEICHRNRSVIAAVAERLMHCGSVTGGALRDLLDDAGKGS